MPCFTEIELLFLELFATTSAVLSHSERAEIQRFVDVGEYGLALETVADIYAEEQKIASPDVVSIVERLADTMSMDAMPLLKRLSMSP